jgi:hypothetical protein
MAMCGRLGKLAAIATFVGAVVCSTGCGGSASNEVISSATLRASVVPRPPASSVAGEGWRKDNTVMRTLAQLRTVLVEPSEASDLKKLERAHFLRFYSAEWSRPAEQRGQIVAESVANLFRDPDGALAGNDPIRSLSREDPNANEATSLAPLKLGKAGWGLHLTGVDEAFVYGFVLRNSVIFVKFRCDPGNCAPGEDVRQAVADYADEITRRATR